MPIIIDANCVPAIFSRTHRSHEDFAPILKWILGGKGMIVIGGSTYMEELKKLSHYLEVIIYLDELGKVIKGDKINIDKLELEVHALYDLDVDFDDPHLPAMVIDTNCGIICSIDSRSEKYVLNKKSYPKGFKKPVYYKTKKNKDLLCDKYIRLNNSCLRVLKKDKRQKLEKKFFD